MKVGRSYTANRVEPRVNSRPYAYYNRHRDESFFVAITDFLEKGVRAYRTYKGKGGQ
ncbi:hypothetical protein LELE5274_03775 [Lederbergia lenta]